MFIKELILSFIPILCLFSFNRFSFPVWNDKTKFNWGFINNISLLVGLFFTVFFIIINKNKISDLPFLIMTSSFAIVIYCLIQSCFTDFDVHLVDRNTLWMSFLFLMINSLFYIALTDSNFFYPGWFIALFISLGFVFTPLIMGASDGRALMISVAAFYPIIGYNEFFNSMIVLVLILFVLALFFKIYKKIVFMEPIFNTGNKTLNFNDELPIVPFILFIPFIYTLFYI